MHPAKAFAVLLPILLAVALDTAPARAETVNCTAITTVPTVIAAEGIYCFTASGKLLAFKNAQDPDVMKDTLNRALAAWKRLPANETAPGGS